jgi:hypothetical protein
MDTSGDAVLMDTSGEAVLMDTSGEAVVMDTSGEAVLTDASGEAGNSIAQLQRPTRRAPPGLSQRWSSYCDLGIEAINTLV